MFYELMPEKKMD